MTQRPSFTRLWASNGQSEDPVAIYNEGWVYGQKPEHEHQNFLQKREEEFFLSNAEDGLPSWRANVNYPKGALVKFGDKSYIALQPSLNVTPPDESYWDISLGSRPLKAVSDELIYISDKNDAHVNNKNNPHETTADEVGTYTKAQVDSKDTAIDTNLASHKANLSNPHTVSFEQLGILPVAGGDFDWVDNEDGNFGLGATTSKVSVSKGASQSTFLVTPTGQMGINALQKPVVVVGADEYHLIHEGNYLERRNTFEPAYASTEPDLELPFANDLTGWYSDSDLTASWDDLVFDKLHGLRLDGTVDFSVRDSAGQELTIAAHYNGDVMANIGGVEIIHTSTDFTVTDGETLICMGGDGHFTYVRSNGMGYLYKDSVKVDMVGLSWPKATPIQASLSAGGFIKGLKIWATALTEEQVTLIA